jgi:diadenylate cyclase
MIPATAPLTASEGGTYFTPAVGTILFLAVVLYFLARILRGTVFGGIVRGLSIALAVLCGMTIASGALLQSEQVLKVLDILLPAVTICLVVLFQPEIRRALLRVRTSIPMPPTTVPDPGLDQVLRAVERLSLERWGALIAWEKDVGLGEFISSGVPLDAELRAETLATVFTPDTPLHDGALVIRGGRIAAAGCVLPLGEGTLPPTSGLRHRAALGLAEHTDAVVLIVSEESGQVSVAREGALEAVPDVDELRMLLPTLLERKA